MATIDIWLFGKPEWEMDFDKATPQDLKDLGENLKDRLGYLRLLKNTKIMGRTDMYKDIKKELVGEELDKLGIKEKEVNVEDFGEEELIDEENN